MVSCYKGLRGGGRVSGNSQSQRSLPRSSGSPSPEAPAWRLEDHAVGTSGEQLQGQGQSGSRGTGQARPAACKAKTLGGAVGNVLDTSMHQQGCTSQRRRRHTSPPAPHSHCLRSQAT